MVQPIPNAGYQASIPQPSIAAAAEPVVRPESVQPRNAPAGDSQKSDQRDLKSESGGSRVEVALQDRPQTSDTPAPQSTSDRGQVVDVTV